MELTYTSGLESDFWSMPDKLDECDDYSIAIDFLNSRDSFQPFGARLAAFITDKLSLPASDSKTIIDALTEQCARKGIAVSEIGSYNTLHNWFDIGKRPKKSVASRRSMFALAFALGLSVDETKDLFHKIFLDRAFNYRDWDYWASNADAGWGAQSTLTGWIQSWIITTLALMEEGTSYWDIATGK